MKAPSSVAAGVAHGTIAPNNANAPTGHATKKNAACSQLEERLTQTHIFPQLLKKLRRAGSVEGEQILDDIVYSVRDEIA
ncbi:hypothetical protein LTS07_004721 [Exophiala sideris]|uniref:Uncharacterized protein n=1 Tax=Exophiala sideris TaxID=1016849 RepID=A0ABR0JDA8_9EURO|nr:hypothetical protein LTS07_004721 [Exophiala sideris]KAK5041026.1 hypothetical protein LTR13_003328 [Exophiala sideris]KAK5061640.1 hypothetical protein LTR69_004822 [Exophiala sideris]KAK5184339.1 hypothetical protein LTR44_003012 [Eurotiomycetes sp. CCFEE 6388]